MENIRKARTSKYLLQNAQFAVNNDQSEFCKISTLKRTSSSQKIQSGQLGEEHAVQFLTENGYKILAKNEIVGKTEIDIVAQKNEEIVFVEVRTREKNKFVLPEETITNKKMSAMLKAAKLWTSKYNYDGYYRIDLIAVTVVDGVVTDLEHYESITEPII